MKKLVLAATILFATLTTTSARAFDLKDILGNAGGAVSGLVDGIFTQSDISVDQMVGTWTSTGSAVCFQSDNFLQKAGGNAAAGTIEGQLDPYFQKYGLTGAVLTVEPGGKFSLKVKGVTLSGTIKKRSDGNFDFTFAAFNKVNIGTIKAYVEKPMSGLKVMFDASKLKSLVSTIAGFTGNSLASTAAKILDSYEGMCVGFSFSGSGTSTSTNSNTNSSPLIDSNKINQLTNTLKNLLK